MRMNRPNRNGGVRYDNRGAEPHRPWPKKHRVRSRAPRALWIVLVAVFVLGCLSALGHLQSQCEAARGAASKLCTD
ncbi:MAG TPA: hypothetical protein PKZ27_03140 [Rhodocyclaceae bacterium]|nr:hypothetical protein [Rhodocyclaceae bacterium]